MADRAARHVGKRRTLRYFPGGAAHLHHPDDGDFLQNRDTGTTYLVLGVRPSPTVVGCWLSDVERVDDWAVSSGDDGVWGCQPLGKGEPAPTITHEAAQAWPP